MGRKLVRVHLPLFWTRPSTKNCYKFLKGPNVSANAFHDSGNNIPGRSINFREYYGRDTRSTGLCDVSATAPRIWDKFQNCVLEPTQKIEFLGELKDNDIVFTSVKSSEYKESVSGGVRGTRDNLVRANTFVRNISFYYSSYSPSTSQFRLSSTTTNSNTKEECILHGHSDIERYGQRGTYIEEKNLELNNGRAIIQPSWQMLMQTNASKKGWGAVCQGIRTGS